MIALHRWHFRLILQTGLLAITVSLTGCQAELDLQGESEITEPNHIDSSLYVQPVSGLADNFIKGVDISTLLEVEQNGGVFFDENNQQKDVLDILAEHGINWIRLRLWNDPYNVYWVDEVNNGQSIEGAVGGGTNDYQTTLTLAKRAKALGFKLLLDFHYSDFWAHPGQQYIPKAWQDLTQTETEQALYQFTYDTLNNLRLDGVFPDMVQIGNEINGGLVFPHGQDIGSAGATSLIQQGIAATRAVEALAGQDCKIMLHLAEGGNSGIFNYAFDAFTAAELDYDIIGASYYPYWHGSMENLSANINALSQKYNKPIVIAETAYGFTTEQGPDEGNNIFSQASADESGYRATPQGQATVIRDIIERLAQVPDEKGLGLFYWEPAWLGKEGAGWVNGQSNGWENQAMFDYQGKVLDSLDVFWKVSATNPVSSPIIDSIEPVVITVDAANTQLNMPDKITLIYNTHKIESRTIAWGDTSQVLTNAAGKYLISGQLDTGESVQVELTVLLETEKLVNAGFESNELTPWQSSKSGLFSIGEAGVYEGNKAVTYWADSDFNGTLSQTISGLENGHYRVSAMIMGESLGQSASVLHLSSAEQVRETQINNTGWLNWQSYQADIQVANNQLTIAFNIDETANSWGWIDNVSLTLIN